jgi:hypothetical protein
MVKEARGPSFTLAFVVSQAISYEAAQNTITINFISCMISLLAKEGWCHASYSEATDDLLGMGFMYMFS